MAIKTTIRKPQRRLVITYEINDGEKRVECRKIISHDLLEQVRGDVKGAVLWHEAETAIMTTETEWSRQDEAA